MIYNKLNEKPLLNDNIIKNNDIEILCYIMLPTKDIYVVDEEFSKNPIAIETTMRKLLLFLMCLAWSVL